VPTDRLVGKNTLAVRLGVERTRRLYVGLVTIAFCSLIVAGVTHPEFLIGLLALPLAVGPVRHVVSGASGPHLIHVLAGTGRLQLAMGVLVVAAGVVFS
jgi:1,4-dihydroxy-2-naphthoate octaprenyltransferase